MKTHTIVFLCFGAVIAVAMQGILLLMLARHFLAPAPMPAAVAGGGGGFAFGPMAMEVMPNEPFLAPGQQPAQACTKEEVQQIRGAVAETKTYEVTGPFTHANLSVFFIHGPDAVAEQKVITLQDALAQNLAVVHDGGLLSVDNRSPLPLFIQGGDIVKGGNQDRVVPYDYLIPAGANRVAIGAFCVESGRSFPRGDELSSSFQVSSAQLPTRSLKLAALHRRSQNDVWNGVSQTQANLSRNIGGAVQARQSQTSLQLTLEHPRVQQAAQSYVNELSPFAGRKENVIGFAVAINGKVQSADVYGSPDLFRSLWPKLLQASAVAALAEKQGDGEVAAPDADSVRAFLTEPEQGQAYRQDVAGQARRVRFETERSLLLETYASAQGNVVHRCFLAK